MRRREPPLDPGVARELEALDAALAGTPTDDAPLAALVEDVRAQAPRFPAGARSALDARVGAGFPPARRVRRRGARDGRVPGARRLLVPAAATVAAGVLALGVVVAGRNGDGGDAGGGASKAVPTQERASGGSGASGAAAGSAAPAAPVPSGVAPAGPAVTAAPARRIERTVRLELGARADRFDAVTDAVVRATQRAGGFVASSEVGHDGSAGEATFVLRIPAARLDGALADLSRLAHVRSLEQATEDLTGAQDGTRARLRDARTRRSALVSALATASGQRAARLRGRLRAADAEVRRLDRALRALRSRTTYATVDLTVSAPQRSSATPRGHDRFTPAAAWRDARRGLEIAAGVLVLGLAFLLPLAAVAGLALLAANAVRRRRREAALV